MNIKLRNNLQQEILVSTVLLPSNPIESNSMEYPIQLQPFEQLDKLRMLGRGTSQ